VTVASRRVLQTTTAVSRHDRLDSTSDGRGPDRRDTDASNPHETAQLIMTDVTNKAYRWTFTGPPFGQSVTHESPRADYTTD